MSRRYGLHFWTFSAMLLLCSLAFAQEQVAGGIPAPTAARQRLTNSQLRQLRDRCAPDAPMSTLGAIIAAESGGNPNAIALDFPKALLKCWRLNGENLRFARQPRDPEEAIGWANYLLARDVHVDLGLMQVSTQHLKEGQDSATLLQPCTNIREGWAIFRDYYARAAARFGPGQLALQHAISAYNTGDDYRGIDNGYLSRVMAALRHLPAECE